MRSLRIRSSLLRDVKSGFSYGRATPAATQPRTTPGTSSPTLGPENIRADSLTSSQIKDRIRRIYVPTGSASVRTGTPVLALQGTNTQYRAWAFDASVAEAIACETVWPTDLVVPSVGDHFTIDVFWTNLAMGGGSVVWDVDVGFLNDNGTPLDGIGLLTAQTTNSVSASPQHQLVVSRITANQFPTNTHDFKSVVFVIRRDAADPGDSLANDAGLLGVTINYTADM